MESVKKLSDVDPRDLAVVERVFGQRIEPTTRGVLILKTAEAGPTDADRERSDELPGWCNVLEGLSDEDLAEFSATLNEPVRLARPTGTDGS